MRELAKPEVLRSGSSAALMSAVASYPRIVQWTDRRYGVWYLEAMLFLCGIVLWAFVFAWHEKYTRRPVFNLKPAPVPVAIATLTGIGGAIFWHFWFDPTLRQITPLEYPKTLTHWMALVLWTMAFTQLYLIFAPFAWLMRLVQHVGAATALTALFGVFVMIIKNRASPTPMPWELFAELALMRLVVGWLGVYLLLRGGVPLVWWWALLFQSRHLWTLDATN